jgi:tRNA threonylcarbamoyladenosine biosynthesis protein TsaB
MFLLAVDTSGKQGSLALARCGQDDTCEVIRVLGLTGGTFSAELVPQIASLLEKHNLMKTDIDAFVAVSGPGSFTGLRIGLAVIKAFAEVMAKPIAAVSLLEVLAGECQVQGKVTSVLDAGRNEVYLGEYDVSDAGTRFIREYLLSRDEWLTSAGQETIATPVHVLAEAARAKGLRVREVEWPRCDKIAQLGWRKIAKGATVSAQDLEANYIGRSEAELFVKGQ